MLYQKQSAIIGSLWDTNNQPRVFLEVMEDVEENMELLTEYDLNVFSLKPQSSYDPFAQPQGFAVWTDIAKANWIFEKCTTDPRNVGNLSVAFVDMVRRDLDALPDMPNGRNKHYHSSFLRPFFDLAEVRLLPCGESKQRARDRLAARNDMNSNNLVYQVDLFHGGVWAALSQLEIEIMMWINVQWMELHNRQARDNLGVLGPRPDRWWEYTQPWSQQ